jgi:hypothetical protein
MSYIMFFLYIFNDLRLEVIVCFVDIGRIIHYRRKACYLFLLICISSYWQDQLCHHHGIIQASFGYLKVRFPGSEVGHKRTILKINMVINVCIYIVLLKNTFISYNNNIQQIGYALELSPVNIL